MKKAIKIMMMALSLSVIYQFACAQSSCQGNKVLMSKGSKGCGCHCQKKCVAPSEVQTYLNNGYYYGNCFGSCCWIRTGEVIPSIEASLTDIYPNPVSNSTTIFFSLSETQKVSFKIFDMTGSLVKNLTEEILEEGENEIIWNASDVNAGMYFLRMEAGTYSAMKKVSVIK